MVFSLAQKNQHCTTRSSIRHGLIFRLGFTGNHSSTNSQAKQQKNQSKIEKGWKSVRRLGVQVAAWFSSSNTSCGAATSTAAADGCPSSARSCSSPLLARWQHHRDCGQQPGAPRGHYASKAGRAPTCASLSRASAGSRAATLSWPASPTQRPSGLIPHSPARPGCPRTAPFAPQRRSHRGQPGPGHRRQPEPTEGMENWAWRRGGSVPALTAAAIPRNPVPPPWPARARGSAGHGP